MLERRRGLFLLGVANEHMRVQVDNQRVQARAAGHPGSGESGTGALGALRPGHLPSRRAAPTTAASRRSSSVFSSRRHVESDATGPNNTG